ncbi:unnamed protein product [Protopolystoma xenopodis]|uniref:Uncharacterized protein n=1 Tax=Protopolystoma xenopodis TaxID=117903 RepID=A0A448WMB4_9PLAT|nr:unnamed protein product [Protopolystoma xenopodis]
METACLSPPLLDILPPQQLSSLHLTDEAGFTADSDSTVCTEIVSEALEVFYPALGTICRNCAPSFNSSLAPIF